MVHAQHADNTTNYRTTPAHQQEQTQNALPFQPTRLALNATTPKSTTWIITTFANKTRLIAKSSISKQVTVPIATLNTHCTMDNVY